MRCPTCAKGALIEIRMRVADAELTFRRCGRCDAKSWEDAEGPIALGRVLELVRVP
ncbi:MAG TPA: hypothetical protein VFW06_08330 [Acidimicrobiia bacterium]|nr:hypothetical protein [Acidimicrobiia bacterium]